MFDIDVRHEETAKTVLALLVLEAAEREAELLRERLLMYCEGHTNGRSDGKYRLRIFAFQEPPTGEVLAILEVKILTGERKVAATIAERMWAPPSDDSDDTGGPDDGGASL